FLVVATRSRLRSRRPPPASTALFPCTTLFRSRPSRAPSRGRDFRHLPKCCACHSSGNSRAPHKISSPASGGSGPFSTASSSAKRSEEHTSELQSRFDIVCRLLLEKKKI